MKLRMRSTRSAPTAWCCFPIIATGISEIPSSNRFGPNSTRREAVVFIHPTRSTLRELDGIPAPFVDFPFDTTRTAIDMVLKACSTGTRECA